MSIIQSRFGPEMAAELRTTWGCDEETAARLLDIVCNGVHVSEGTVHQAVQLDALGKGRTVAVRHALTCNVGKAVEAIAAFAATLGGLLAQPWVGLIGLFLLIKRLRDCATVDLNHPAAPVVWMMWRMRTSGDTSSPPPELTLKSITAALKQEMNTRGLTVPKEGEVWYALKELEKLGIVEETAKDKWEIVDIIRVNRSF